MRTPCDWLFEKVDQQHVARSNKQSVKTFEIKDRKNNLRMYLLGKQDFPRWLKKFGFMKKIRLVFCLFTENTPSSKVTFSSCVTPVGASH